MTTFISYSRSNSDFAVRLAEDLKSARFDVWLDQLDIPTGTRWDDEIERVLELSDTFMIVLSPESMESQNVKDEIGYAIDSGKNILPVVIQNCRIPFRLRRFQYVDFTESTYEESLAKIKNLLGSIGETKSIKSNAGEHDRPRTVLPRANSPEVMHKVEQKPKIVNKNEYAQSGYSHKRWPYLLAAIVGVALVALTALFLYTFLKPEPPVTPNVLSATTTPVVELTKTVLPTAVIPTQIAPTQVLPTSSETPDPNPRLSTDNLTNILMAEGFDRSLRSVSEENYSSQDYISRREFTYTASLSNPDSLVWHWYWCARNEAILSGNFEHIQVTFSLNGQEIPRYELVEDQYLRSDSVCRVFYVTLYDWPAGTHHLLNYVSFDQQINDGWDDYPAQTRTYDYLVYISR